MRWMPVWFARRAETGLLPTFRALLGFFRLVRLRDPGSLRAA